jgi:hypothetical protein
VVQDQGGIQASIHGEGQGLKKGPALPRSKVKTCTNNMSLLRSLNRGCKRANFGSKIHKDVAPYDDVEVDALEKCVKMIVELIVKPLGICTLYIKELVLKFCQ